MTKIKQESHDMIIGTDQNLDYLKINKHQKTAQFFDFNMSSGILPCFTKPTRVTQTTATLIDNIYISDCRQSYNSAILTCDVSDHFPCLLFLEKNTLDIENRSIIKSRKFEEKNIASIKGDLSNVDWGVLTDLNTEDSYNLLSDEISKSMNRHAPIKSMSVRNAKIIREEWMTSALLKSSNTCNLLYRKCLGLEKSDPKYVKYIKYRNMYNSLKRKCKIKFYKDRIENYKHNARKLWDTLKCILGKANDKSTITSGFIINNKCCI